jgi:hypothetical protein
MAYLALQNTRSSMPFGHHLNILLHSSYDPFCLDKNGKDKEGSEAAVLWGLGFGDEVYIFHSLLTVYVCISEAFLGFQVVFTL